MKSQLLKGLGALGLMTGMTLAVAVPAQAAEFSPRAAACITSFTVHTSEDWGADGDEPYLVTNTGTWYAPGSMDDGSTAAVNRTVDTGTVVQAWDDDSPDGDDFIGSATVGSGGTLNFQGDDAHYTANYRLGAC
ncbi:hypothetical protein K3N28_09740 [Glycomyces sp. TRM65418]|uniref:hypothetical protein n=1 Tax=Glycomyces sp. TRM65418 TaxID=2867006 RepID=UPI001CE56E2C|nr:hypothetical protein [Glycomyces sp. TRM65418]MCC3763353.1 hypothetical protein [Glycomyces sp. TRM65418]QZD57347.1 hypothetical protein K3N28_09680 [Glycomyces sp. TRM65418]